MQICLQIIGFIDWLSLIWYAGVGNFNRELIWDVDDAGLRYVRKLITSKKFILTEASTAWCFKCSPWGHIHIHVLYHISYVVPRPEHMLSRSSMYVNSKEWLVDYNLGVQRAHLKAGPLMKLLYTQFSFSLKSDQVYKRLQVFPLSPKLIRKLTHSEQNPMFVLAKLFLHQINFSFLTKE